MKTLIPVFICVCQWAHAQEITTDSVATPFSKVYDQSAVFVPTTKWDASNTPSFVGLKWNMLQPVFEQSPAGMLLYQDAVKQRKIGGRFGAISLGLNLGAISYTLASISSGSGIRGFKPAIPLTMLAGGIATVFVSGYKMHQATQNFSKGIWVRNRDMIASKLSPTLQPAFRQFYNQNTFYTHSGIIIKDNKKYGTSIFDSDTKALFEGSELGMIQYQTFRNKQAISFGIGVVGTVIMLFSFNSKGLNIPMYMGGLLVSTVSSFVQESGMRNLREAVYLTNRDLLVQRYPAF